MKIVLIIFLIIAGISILIYMFNYFSGNTKKVGEYFSKIAKKYELSLDESNKIGTVVYPLITGIYKRRQVGIGCFIGSGKEKEAQTYIRVQCSNRHNITFHLRRRLKKGLISDESGAVNMMDTEFDEKYIVNSASAEYLFSVFTFNVKYSLLQALHLGLKGELNLQNNLIDYTEPGLIKDENSQTRIELLMHIICDIADELEKN